MYRDFRRLPFRFHQRRNLRDRKINIYNAAFRCVLFLIFLAVPFRSRPIGRNFFVSFCVPLSFRFASFRFVLFPEYSIHFDVYTTQRAYFFSPFCAFMVTSYVSATIIKNLMDRVMVVKSNLERCNQNSEYGSQRVYSKGK